MNFRRAYSALPDRVKVLARRAYKQFQHDPNNPGLEFKAIKGTKDLYSVRVGLGYRALGLVVGDVIVWDWIGSHSDYDKLIP